MSRKKGGGVSGSGAFRCCGALGDRALYFGYSHLGQRTLVHVPYL
jgi:hypothetical protein